VSHHVLVSDSVHPSALDVLKAADLPYTAPGQMKRDEAIAALPNADALIIRSATKADKEFLSHASKLKVIARAGVGVDNVDLAAATERGIIVMNTPDGNTVSTAEHTFALMLALVRQIPQAHASLLAGKWDRKSFMGVELRNKTLGVVGYGRIGRAVAKRAMAFDMHVLAYDPFVTSVNDGAQLVDLDTLLRQSDFISLHALLTDETRDMINATSIAKMKQGVRIIDAARGALVNEADLAAAIKSGHVAGAGLDVFQNEPVEENNPLIGLANVVHTPHLAASTEDAQTVVTVDAAQLVADALLKGQYANVVNPAALK
jgi:D-3-phosphoglycerate dehydrogenase / 2-oxoglutarate reductase